MLNGYARVSTRDQQPDVQRDALRQAERVRIFEENGVCPAGFEPVTGTLEDAYFLLMRAPALTAGAIA